MDTKLKNIKYSRGMKITAAIILWLSFMSAVGSGFFLAYNEETVTNKSYYDTNKFKNEFTRYAHNVVELNVKLKSEENIKASGQEQDVIANNLDRLYRIKNRLSSAVNFGYYIKNLQTGEHFTNVDIGDAAVLIKQQPIYININNLEPNWDYSLQEDIRQMLSGTSYEGYAAVMEPLKQGDAFYDGFASFSKVKTLMPYAIAVLIVSIILLISAFVYLVYFVGRRANAGEIVLSPIDRIYTDVYTLFVFIAAVISIGIAGDISHGSIMQTAIFISILLSIDVFIGLSYTMSMIRQIKNRQIIKNSVTFKIYNVLRSFIGVCFNGKMFKAWMLLLLLAYGGVSSILFAIITHTNNSLAILIFGFLLIAFNAVCIYFASKSLMSLTMIMNAAKEISAGNLDYLLEKSKISIAFSGFAEDIQSIQGGLKKAVAEAIKGERMKTDLITNVSHDLKTPLTSIINYVDLLKKEHLDNEKACEYVCILEDKSARLKQLIEDLVEASKASSGNITVKAEKVDLNELVMQACGEYEEKIKKAALDIRTIFADKNTLISADGKHMWRIVENLLSNAVKYSMPNSRIYINIDKSHTFGLLTIKNMSAFALNIPAEQLTERFVRGDASRTTEGSGLGLSIAQSLTALQGGRFSIDIDGDLFKVMVEIPLWQGK